MRAAAAATCVGVCADDVAVICCRCWTTCGCVGVFAGAAVMLLDWLVTEFVPVPLIVD